MVPTLTPYSNAPPPSEIGKNKLEEIAITVAMLLPKKKFSTAVLTTNCYQSGGTIK